MWGGHWMFGGFMGLYWIVGLVALFFFVKWIVQQRMEAQRPKESAVEILKKRYAKGEINKDEFERKKRDL